MSDSVRLHRWQPTRLLRPWDSPGMNSGVSFHFLLQCMKVKSESEVAQSCPTLSDPMGCSPPGFSVHGIFQTRVLEWVAVAFGYISMSAIFTDKQDWWFATGLGEGPGKCHRGRLCSRKMPMGQLGHKKFWLRLHFGFLCSVVLCAHVGGFQFKRKLCFWSKRKCVP